MQSIRKLQQCSAEQKATEERQHSCIPLEGSLAAREFLRFEICQESTETFRIKL